MRAVDGFGYSCALVLAAVFVRSGSSKLADPQGTARSFSALGVPAAGAAARIVAPLELALAVLLLALPRAGGVAALALLGGFSAVLARAVRSGSTAPCNCIGSSKVDPVSWADIVRNAMLGLLGIAALIPTAPVMPTPVEALAVAAIVVTGSRVPRRYR